MNAPKVSVAIPLYNEEAVVETLIGRVLGVLDGLEGGPHELVFTDDGSRDRTVVLVKEAIARDPRIKLVCLSRNFGHQPALSAGLAHTTGDVVVAMDGDLQDRPEAIPDLLAAYAKGYDVAYVVRTDRKESLFLRSLYKTAYWMIARLSDTALPVDAGDFSLMSRRVVDLMVNAPERHRYLRGLRAWSGFKQTAVPVERDARAGGESKYSLWGLTRLALDGIFSFSTAPIRAATLAGMGAVAIALLYSAYALVARVFLDTSPQGFTALFFGIVFMGGTQLLFLGVIGEYVGRIYNEVKQRPIYIVDQVFGAS